MTIATTTELGELIRARRTSLGLRQQDVALTANVGVRFIVDIENGKETSQVGLVLRLLQALGIRLNPEMSPVPTARPTDEDSEPFDPDNFLPTP
ncbi:helix-turn-helix transcriptional regulator [Bradyrhizobium sp. CCGUVB23]|uniref:helix-turn-helix transcriptional regulator n=1 Tax=Bradyrhizobium sp. CCGUVB23 TaxID=2949630 RepID=UPI0020B2E310|nr:helix-turn-helix transcriptional regulator [Bradyrhizobium sp. CCGUVB23]MCP3468339.1 helix-turn-helix transcriptional regulator [Bradyrhizobium sp. CCGUVB23]